MAIDVVCTGCGKRYALAEQLAGKRAKCKKCGTVIVIPRVVHVARPLEPPPEIPVEDDPFAALGALGFDEPEPAPVAAAPRFMPLAPSAKVDAPTVSTIAAPTRAIRAPRTPKYQAVEAAQLVPQTSNGWRDMPGDGVDTPSLLLIVVYLIVCVAAAIYFYTQGAEYKVPAEILSSLVSRTLVAVICCYFVVMTLPVMLAIFITSRLFRYRMPSGGYLKCAGLVALPQLVITFGFVALPKSVLVMLVVIVSIIPIFYFVLRMSFKMSGSASVVAFFLSAIGWTGGYMATEALVALVIFATIRSHMNDRPPADPPAVVRADPQHGSRPAPQVAPVMPVAPSEWVHELDSARALRDHGFYDAREPLLDDVANARAAIEAAKATRSEPPPPELDAIFAELEKKAAKLPYANPDPAIYQSAKATDDWTTAAADLATLGEPVSVGTYRLRLAPDMLVDLSSSEASPGGLNWTLASNAFATLNVRFAPVEDSKQQQPWVVSLPSQEAAGLKAHVFTIECDQALSSTGMIGGRTFTRIAAPVLEHTPDRMVTYVLGEGDQWLVMSIKAPVADLPAYQTLELIAHSLRPAESGEARIDPFGAPFLAAHLSDPHRVMIIGRLVKIGPAGEDAVVAYLQNPQVLMQQRALEVLDTIGTVRSLPSIQKAAVSADRDVATAARKIWRRLKPTEFDGVAEAMLDLAQTDPAAQARAFVMLAALPPDARRDVIGPTLNKMIWANPAVAADVNARHALGAWADPKTLDCLLDLLSEKEDPARRALAISVLGYSGQQRVVGAIIRCTLIDPRSVTDALIAFGPGAEGEVIRLLQERDDRAKHLAVAVLERIGGPKSIHALNTVWAREFAAEVKDAQTTIRARLATTRQSQ